MRRVVRAAIASSVAAVSLVVLASPAAAHAKLVSSTPAGGSTVAESPAEILIRFSERIESSFGGIQVFGPSGARVETAPPEIAGSQLRLPMEALAAPGPYTVVFRVISADGHPVEASFSFVFAPPPPPESTTPTTAAPPPLARDFDLEDAGRGTAAGLWLSRLLNYAALTVLVGALVAALVLLPRSATTSVRFVGRLARIAALVLALSCGLLFAFGLSNAAARPLSGVLSGDLLGRFAATRFGTVVLAQGVVALAALVLLTLSRGRDRAAQAALGVAAIAGVAPALWGHAGTDEIRAVAVASDWAHVAATTSWMGGLAILAAIFGRRADEDRESAEATRRFSGLATWMVVVVGLTGVVNALLHLGAVGNLTATSWGKLVLAKVALFALAASFGWANRRAVLPRLESTPESRRPFVRFAFVEVLTMTLALGVATQLASSVPADAEAAARVQSFASAFGAGQINVTVDPAIPGTNVVHLYFLSATGQVDDRPRDPTLTFSRAGARRPARLVRAGPGHFSALGQRIPASGQWVVTVEAVVGVERVRASGAISVR